jgi:hypothetical protein
LELIWRSADSQSKLIQKYITTEPLVMLCHRCIGVLQNTANVVDIGTENDRSWVVCAHHSTVSTLAASAAEGCHVCQPFWSQLSKPEQVALYLEESRGEAHVLRSSVEKENELGRLTHITLHSDSFREGYYFFSVRFDYDYIDWTRVSKKKEDVAISIYNLQPVQSMLLFLFTDR